MIPVPKSSYLLLLPIPFAGLYFGKATFFFNQYFASTNSSVLTCLIFICHIQCMMGHVPSYYFRLALSTNCFSLALGANSFTHKSKQNLLFPVNLFSGVKFLHIFAACSVFVYQYFTSTTQASSHTHHASLSSFTSNT